MPQPAIIPPIYSARQSAIQLYEECGYEFEPIFQQLKKLGLDNPVVRHIIFAGVHSEIKTVKYKNRKLTKLGRGDEIRNSKMREEAEIAVRSASIIDQQLNDEFSATLTNILKEHENSILMKWQVAGIPLGIATPEILRSEAYNEEQSATGHSKTALFYRQIADLGAPNTPIAMSVSVEQVERLRTSIFETNFIQTPPKQPQTAPFLDR